MSDSPALQLVGSLPPSLSPSRSPSLLPSLLSPSLSLSLPLSLPRTHTHLPLPQLVGGIAAAQLVDWFEERGFSVEVFSSSPGLDGPEEKEIEAEEAERLEAVANASVVVALIDDDLAAVCVHVGVREREKN